MTTYPKTSGLVNPSRSIFHLSPLDVVWVVTICAYSGTFGLHSLLVGKASSAANAYLAFISAAALVIGVWGVFRYRDTLVRSTIVFGMFPWFYLASIKFVGGDTTGCFSYLYKLSPFLVLPLWISLMRHGGGNPFTRALYVTAAIICVRQLIVFLFPWKFGERLATQIYDATYVYGYEGSIPRVFGPGMGVVAIVFLGLAKGILNRGVTWRAALGCAICLLTIFTALSRAYVGALAISLVVLFILGYVQNATAGKAMLACIVSAMLLFTGYLFGAEIYDLLPNALQERFSADARNIDWRSRQLDIAFEESTNWEWEWIVGVGPNAFIQNDPNDRNVVVNEIHYSYASILWTFGFLGLSLLLINLGSVLWRGVVAARRGSSHEWVSGLCFLLLVAITTPVFTQTDWCAAIVICFTGIICGERHPIQTARLMRP